LVEVVFLGKATESGKTGLNRIREKYAFVEISVVIKLEKC